MGSETVLGPGLGRFYAIDDATWWKDLDERESRLLDGALSVHALSNPRSGLRVVALGGETATPPVLTGPKVRQLDWLSANAPVALLEVSTPGFDPETAERTDLVLDLGGPHPAFTQTAPTSPSAFARARFTARTRAPVAFDALRQFRTDMLERRTARREMPRTRTAPPAPAPDDGRGRTRAVLFGLHWLELGGAERWALECIAAARSEGLLPIVVTDRPSSSPWLTRPEMADAVFLPLTSRRLYGKDAALLNSVFEQFDVRGIHVHHCTWLYERLPWIRTRWPGVPVVDSLHILEWRTGGFVNIATRVSDAIDVHHVISPQLRDYLIDHQQVPRGKVELATLADLTSASRGRPEDRDTGTTIAFVGRLTQQKRPYLFVRLAALLRKRLPGARFILHGDGELSDEITGLIARLGLSDVLEVRGVDRPVSATLDESDVMVITSDNEGVTLTTFEADAHDTLVISTDVGSQRSVVVDDLLCPRHPIPFLRSAQKLVVRAVTDAAARERWLDQQHRKVTAFAQLPHARDWTRDLYRKWNS
jgi:glycosyltransferase involved in cell wall biosynthesis